MVTATLSDTASSIKQLGRTPKATVSDDHGLLVLLLEKLVHLVEQLWHEEMRAKTARDIPLLSRQVILCKAHQALGEWFEYETLERQNSR